MCIYPCCDAMICSPHVQLVRLDMNHMYHSTTSDHPELRNLEQIIISDTSRTSEIIFLKNTKVYNSFREIYRRSIMLSVQKSNAHVSARTSMIYGQEVISLPLYLNHCYNRWIS